MLKDLNSDRERRMTPPLGCVPECSLQKVFFFSNLPNLLCANSPVGEGSFSPRTGDSKGEVDPTSSGERTVQGERLMRKTGPPPSGETVVHRFRRRQVPRDDDLHDEDWPRGLKRTQHDQMVRCAS